MKSVAVIKSELLTGPGTFSIHCLLTSTFHLQAAIASVTHGNPKKRDTLTIRVENAAPKQRVGCFLEFYSLAETIELGGQYELDVFRARCEVLLRVRERFEGLVGTLPVHPRGR